MQAATMTMMVLNSLLTLAQRAAAVGFLLLLAGCIPLYIPPFGSISAERLGKIKVGSTTRQQVVDLLGEPDRLKHENFSVYDLYSSKGFLIFAVGGLPAGALLPGPALDTRLYRVLLEFDSNAVVKRYEIQEEGVNQPKIFQSGGGVTAPPKIADAEIKRILKGVVRGLLGSLEMQFRSVAFSPDGRVVAAGDSRKQVWLWDAETGEQKMVLNEGGPFVRFSPDGKLLATVSGTRPTLWELPSATKKLSFEGHGSSGFFTGSDVHALAFAADSKTIVSGAEDGSIKVWEAATGKVLKTFKEAEGISSIMFLPDGEILAATSKEVILWELATGKELRRITLEAGRAHQLRDLYAGSEESARALSPDGKLLAVATLSHVEIWRLPLSDRLDQPAHAESGGATSFRGRGELVTVFLLPRYSFTRPSAVFSLDGSKVAASAGGAVIGDLFTRHAIFGYYPPVPLRAGTERDFFARDVAFSPDGRTLAIATDRGVYLSDVRTEPAAEVSASADRSGEPGEGKK